MIRIQRLFTLIVFVLSSALLAAGDKTTPNDTIAAAVQSLADSNNAFALDMYSHLRGTDGNLFFSPYSIETALMMVRAGAAGPTADEMTKVLKMPDQKPADLNPAIAALAGRFAASAQDNGYELHVANAMWGQTGVTFLPAYKDQLRKTFDAKLGWVDFRMPDAAAGTINASIDNATHHRIKDLISAGALNAATKLLLTDAIYLKADWTSPFKKSATFDAPWNDGTSAANANAQRHESVSMMYQAGDFDYSKEDGFAALQMPYVGDDLTMLVLLPDNPTGLADFEKSLDTMRLQQIVGTLQRDTQVEVSFPKYTLEATYDLSQTLAKMGMPTVFSGQADLSGIDGKHDLSITGLVHKAFVKVDETGTEAAGATGEMTAGAAPQEKVFVVDHPFIFVIRDVKTCTILFIGRVEHPNT